MVKSSPAVDEGKAAIFTVEDLPAGEYVFFCTRDLHRLVGPYDRLAAQRARHQRPAR